MQLEVRVPLFSRHFTWPFEADSPRNDPVEVGRPPRSRSGPHRREERHKALERSQELTEPSTALNTSYDHEDDASEASYESDFEQSPAHAGDAVGSYARGSGPRPTGLPLQHESWRYTKAILKHSETIYNRH